MDIVLWVLQAFLAFVFGVAGITKLTLPRERFIARQPWAAELPDRAVRVIGALELLGAAGLILPAATGIAPILTPLAAVGLGLTMIGAMAFHLRRNAVRSIAPNVVLLATAAVVVVGLL